MSLKNYKFKDLIEVGCDEAGRGCLAGPVFAAAVILPKNIKAPELDDSKKLSSKIIDIAYGYDLGPVAFNPTWTYQEKNFRATKRGALSYFVGGDSKFKQDPGFAIGSPENERSQWVKCEVKNAVIQLLGGKQLKQE